MSRLNLITGGKRVHRHAQWRWVAGRGDRGHPSGPQDLRVEPLREGTAAGFRRRHRARQPARLPLLVRGHRSPCGRLLDGGDWREFYRVNEQGVANVAAGMCLHRPARRFWSASRRWLRPARPPMGSPGPGGSALPVSALRAQQTGRRACGGSGGRPVPVTIAPPANCLGPARLIGGGDVPPIARFDIDLVPDPSHRRYSVIDATTWPNS